MEVMVADTSVLIDLERGGLIEDCFALPYRFTVPDLLYERELAGRRDGSRLGQTLMSLGLGIEELDGDEVSAAIRYREERPALSLPDSFALSLSTSRGWTLLTGDGVLRAFAMALNVVCHGVLWLMDQLFEAGISSAEVLHSGLRAIGGHPRCRLPQSEIQSRLQIYSSY